MSIQVPLSPLAAAVPFWIGNAGCIVIALGNSVIVDDGHATYWNGTTGGNAIVFDSVIVHSSHAVDWDYTDGGSVFVLVDSVIVHDGHVVEWKDSRIVVNWGSIIVDDDSVFVDGGSVFLDVGLASKWNRTSCGSVVVDGVSAVLSGTVLRIDGIPRKWQRGQVNWGIFTRRYECFDKRTKSIIFWVSPFLT